MLPRNMTFGGVGDSFPVQPNKDSSQVKGVKEFGISSAIAELEKTVLSVSVEAVNLRSALGINVPSEDNRPIPPETLLQRMVFLASVLREVHADITAAISHLNS